MYIIHLGIPLILFCVHENINGPGETIRLHRLEQAKTKTIHPISINPQ